MASLNTTNLELRLEQVIALLREANDEYNWDPATFAVTVVIGAIATLLTVLAIGQGLLAAGPGRLKSGHYAVGPWSETQKTRFAWGEWRFRTTVETPIIRLLRRREGWFRTSNEQDSDIDIDIDHGPSLAIPNRFSIPDRFRRLYYKFQFLRLEAKSKRYSEYFPATWLKLLTVLHLDSPKLWDGERLGADYIPSDLPAAQAYGSIKDVSILTLMCADGAAVVRQDSVNGLPFVQGKSRTSVTLSFRDHPLLGIAGSLSTFDTRDTWERDVLSSGPGRDSRKLQHLSKSLDYAFGGVAMSNAGIGRLYGAPSPGDIVFPGKGCLCDDRLSRMATLRQGPASTSIPWRNNEAVRHKLFALAMAAPPNMSPPAFPIVGANLFGMLALFATQSTLWNLGVSPAHLGWAQSGGLSGKLKNQADEWLASYRARQATGTPKPELPLDESVLKGCIDLMSNLMPHGTAKEMTPNTYFQHLETRDCPNRLPMRGGYHVRVGFQTVKRSIEHIDDWVQARQETLSEWVKTACVMSEIASVIEALAQKMPLIRRNESTTAVEEWNETKRSVFLYYWQNARSDKERHPHAADISIVLDYLVGLWDFGEPLPRAVDLPGYVLADLMVYRVVLIVVALSAWSADSTILLDDKYDRVVPIL